jgi:hypothetical protein
MEVMMRRFWKRALVLCGCGFVLLIVLFFAVYRPWALSWGASDEEIERAMPGDEIVDSPTFVATRAVLVESPPEAIWPWLVQIGYRKAGFYSWDQLDNDGIASSEEIIPAFQNLKVGDMIPLSATAFAEVRLLEPNRFMLLEIPSHSMTHSSWSWAWGLYPVDGRQTRLVTRLRVRFDGVLRNLAVDALEIIMMRKHMLELKRRAEAQTPG